MPLDPKRPRHFGVLGFLEASVLPMPIEIITAPFMIAYPKRAIRMARAMWLGCMIAALALYGLSFMLYEPLVAPALETFGLSDEVTAFQERFSTNGLFWTVLTMALMPMPLQIASIGAGLVQGNLIVFLAAVATGRAIRYFGLAALSRLLGPKVEHILVSKRFGVSLLIGSVMAILALYFYLR